jgi:hypothetical protein
VERSFTQVFKDNAGQMKIIIPIPPSKIISILPQGIDAISHYLNKRVASIVITKDDLKLFDSFGKEIKLQIEEDSDQLDLL